MSPIVQRVVIVVYLIYGVICTDIDLQTCIDNFNIHRDKIIRTQDSQNMGAKYLNEIDLGSREECLRLCCETDNCDVFVFEEKNSGSCYLFHCGPPEDFKCKFTHHVNYSSAVLSINRHLPDLESQIKLTKHEQDLTKLRRVESEADVLKPAVMDVKKTFTASTTTLAPKEILPLRKSKEEEAPAPVSAPSGLPASTSGKCSRFQFECRGGNGECIAIYNACDGVPQCADGSDEAPELGCPDMMVGNAPPTNTQAPPPRVETEVQRAGLKQIHPVYDGGMPNMVQPGPQAAMPHQDVMPPYQPAAPVPYPNHFSQVPQDFLRPEPKQGYRVPYEPPPYVAGQTLQQQWVPHQPNQVLPQQQQMQVQYPVGKNSRMFSHKENNLQMQDGHELSQMQYGDSSIANYNKLDSGYYGDNYRQPIQQENWPADVSSYNNQGFYQEKVNQIEEQPRKNPTYNSQPIEVPEIKQDTVNPKHVQEKLAHDLKHSKENMEHGSIMEKKPKIEKHHRDQYPDVVAIRIDENDLQDGIAQTPRGAVLSVALGLIITFIMAVMIVCRLRMVRRRIRKGGKSYAHDADFLVNGMYL